VRQSLLRMNFSSEVLAVQLANLDPHAFEDLVYALVRAQHTDALQVGAKDGGVDILVPSGAWGLQCKRFLSGIHWGQCESSYASASSQYTLQRYTFVFSTQPPGSGRAHVRRTLCWATAAG
jgi:hypothetical protein